MLNLRVSSLSLIFIVFLGSLPFINGDVPERSQEITDVFIGHCQHLLDQRVMGIAELGILTDSNKPINPASGSKAYGAESTNKAYDQLNTIIEQNVDDIDIQTVHTWAQQQAKVCAENIDAEIEKVRRPMTFLGIPTGNYNSQIDGSTITISNEVAIQTTPVTQAQWLRIMRENPSRYNNKSLLANAYRQKVTPDMLPDNPVESVSYTDVQAFIEKLNEHNDDYYYVLPSLNEYQALLQYALGADWLEKARTLQQPGQNSPCTVPIGLYNPLYWVEVRREQPSEENITCAVTAGSHVDVAGQNVWDIIGNVWEYTRDHIELDGDLNARLVFGTSHKTTPTMSSIHELVRPIVYDRSRGQSLGFRLVRVLKKRVLTKDGGENFLEQDADTTYSSSVFEWNEETAKQDTDWRIEQGIFCHEDDVIALMLERKEHYPVTMQPVIDALITTEKDQKDPGRYLQLIRAKDPARYLKVLTTLDLSNTQLIDVRPLAKLPSLEDLNLSDNQITDPSPLARLPHLENLYLKNNQIADASGLSQLTTLEELDLDENQINTVEPFIALENLGHLHLNANNIIDVSLLSQLKNLRHLGLINNGNLNISSLKKLQQLTSLELSNNQITDISVLSGLTNLMDLSLENNTINNIGPLARMRNLSLLNLNNNQVEEIQALSNLSNLMYLFLAGNQIKDIKPLYMLYDLNGLDLSDNNPLIEKKDIEPLLECSFISFVHYATESESSGYGLSNCMV